MSSDVSALVADAMNNSSRLTNGGQHRYAVDGLVHQFRAFATGSAEQRQIGTEVGTYVTGAETVLQRAFALSFFASCPGAPGGDALGSAVENDCAGYQATTQVPVGGVLGRSMREALLYQALRWNRGAVASGRVLQTAQEDALVGDGAALLDFLQLRAPEWFQKHESTFLSLYPEAPGTVWDARVQRGESGLQVLQSLLPGISPVGRTSLRGAIQFSDDVSAEQKRDLLEALVGESTPASAGQRVTVKEGTLGRVGTSRVGCGNLWEREFDDGQRLMSARVAPEGAKGRVVRVGDTVQLGDEVWAVVSIQKAEGQKGAVSFESRR